MGEDFFLFNVLCTATTTTTTTTVFYNYSWSSLQNADDVQQNNWEINSFKFLFIIIRIALL
jgi:hypothetical protein